MSSPGNRLRGLTTTPGGVLAAGVYDCLSARAVELAGFQLGVIGGNALTASLLGYPDIGLTTLTETVEQARRIVNSVNIPLIADADNGYGNVLNVMRTVHEFESAGIAAIALEDQASPRRSSTIGEPILIPKEEAAAKIRAACQARRDEDFVIIARTDARLIEGLEGAIGRMSLYVEAGADIAFFSSLQSRDELVSVVKATQKPVMLNVVEGSGIAQFTCDELLQIGFSIVGYSGFLQRAAMKAMADVSALFLKERTTEGGVRKQVMSTSERNGILRLQTFKDFEAKLL